MRKSITVLFLSFIVLFAFTQKASAACPLPHIGSVTFTTADSCSISDYKVVDAGTGTTNTAKISLPSSAPGHASITMNNGGYLYLGSLDLNSGNISIQVGGTLGFGKVLYAKDADADGWPDNSTLSTTQSAGYVRVSSLNAGSISSTSGAITVDCDGGATNSTSNVCCSGIGAACSADATCCTAVCGTDADLDSYFSTVLGHTGTCHNAAHPYTDCYDGNAGAYPNEPNSYTSTRGDGSWDWNCSGTIEGQGGSHGDCSCSGCGTYGTIANCPGVSDPGCGQSWSGGTVDESHQGGTCYNNTGSFCISTGGTVACK